MRGLLVEAGFSLEFGMPLVSQLDEEIYGQLTPEKICSYNNKQLFLGTGFNKNVIEEFTEKLVKKSLNYEQLMGWLQTKSLNNNIENREDFYNIYVLMLDISLSS